MTRWAADLRAKSVTDFPDTDLEVVYEWQKPQHVNVIVDDQSILDSLGEWELEQQEDGNWQVSKTLDFMDAMKLRSEVLSKEVKYEIIQSLYNKLQSYKGIDYISFIYTYRHYKPESISLLKRIELLKEPDIFKIITLFINMFERKEPNKDGSMYKIFNEFLDDIKLHSEAPSDPVFKL